VGKEEIVSVHGGREENAKGISGVRGSPDTFLAEARMGKSIFFWDFGRKNTPLGRRYL